ncbi:RDD family protein [Kineosporia succinea]|uniref:RDD family membrane protein YckC n=1 Tax=Kineosporia succinea TaxID=84632 RepID=A0ABT9NY76_9ACTN|nr:RDD family protein [Kineosporia succinea]MDP9825394.1 putative RDD family membrane protein YckC [Kineosporia succinea]
MITDPLAPMPSGQNRSVGLTGLVGVDELDFSDELVTGEAVVLELRPASFITRALAVFADLLVTVSLLALLLIWLAFGTTGSIDEAAGSALMLVSVLAIAVGLPILVETLTRGRSLGKWLAGLRVVRDDGGPIRARHALIRGLLAVLEIYWSAGSVALLTSLMNKRGKRLGDLVAGTYVIRERQPRQVPPPIMMPPHLALWVRNADLGRLPDPLARASRQFLARAAKMAPESRQRLGWSLAGQLGDLVAPPPPPGTHPEDFIAAVLAERRDRDYARLWREKQQCTARLDSRATASPLSATGAGLPDHN